jgi:hypothetical protein
MLITRQLCDKLTLILYARESAGMLTLILCAKQLADKLTSAMYARE